MANLMAKNPSDENLEWLIDQSEVKTANWIRDTLAGDCYYWTAVETTHDQMAEDLQINNYDKGFAI